MRQSHKYMPSSDRLLLIKRTKKRNQKNLRKIRFKKLHFTKLGAIFAHQNVMFKIETQGSMFIVFDAVRVRCLNDDQF